MGERAVSTPAKPGERLGLPPEEFAARWSVSPEHIHALRKAGKLPYLRDGRDGFSFPVAACDRAMLGTVLTAKTDPIYLRDRKSGKRCGSGNARAAR